MAMSTVGSGEAGQQSSEQALGKRLQEARRAVGLTQQQLCHKAGLSYSTLAKIERGAIKAPSVFTIQNVAITLGITLDALVGMPELSPASGKRQSRSGVRFVYFDINGCLVRFFHRAFAELAAETGAPPDLIESTFWHYNDAVCRGDMSLDEFNTVLAEKLGAKQVDWSSYYLAAVDPIQEMQELLAWAAQHYYVGLLSNIMPGLIQAMLERGILPAMQYDQIIDSSQAHAIKPEPEIYQVAQARANVPAEQILLVDDSRTNLMAAEHQGWHVLWFDDYRPAESVERIRKTLELETTQ
jgi:FMN phosphatase YigB (HAD superfamily)/DNA-binding XRE family transcriptional regulator